MKISFLGPKGTYCFEACKEYIKEKENIQMRECKTITDTIISLINDEVDICIVPIENSIQGSVFETMDNLLENEQLVIVDELVLDINHYLMTKKGTKAEEIKEIYSHPQALAQCRKYIQKNYKNCRIKQMPSTAFSAEEVSRTENTACIVNKACSLIYDLDIIGDKIQDSKHNQTRFIILSKKEREFGNKTSIIFSTQNQPGELYRILGLFNIFKVNLTKIESRPAKTRLGEYIFWLDFDGNKNEDEIQILIKQIKKSCSYFRIIGTY